MSLYIYDFSNIHNLPSTSFPVDKALLIGALLI
jgi:hypothetical protein